jgi:hypothetical protein
MTKKDSADALKVAIARYYDAWNAHELKAIIAMHAPERVFAKHTAGEAASVLIVSAPQTSGYIPMDRA